MPPGVLEAVGGMVIGPLYGWAWDGDLLDLAAQAGLALIAYQAGRAYVGTVPLSRPRPRSLVVRAVGVLGLLAVAIVFSPAGLRSAVLLALALSPVVFGCRLSRSGRAEGQRTAWCFVAVAEAVLLAEVLTEPSVPVVAASIGLTVGALLLPLRGGPRGLLVKWSPDASASADGDRAAWWSALSLAFVVAATPLMGPAFVWTAFPVGVLSQVNRGSGATSPHHHLDSAICRMLISVACVVTGLELGLPSWQALMWAPLLAPAGLGSQASWPKSLSVRRPLTRSFVLRPETCACLPFTVALLNLGVNGSRLPEGVAADALSAAVGVAVASSIASRVAAARNPDPSLRSPTQPGDRSEGRGSRQAGLPPA